MGLSAACKLARHIEFSNCGASFLGSCAYHCPFLGTRRCEPWVLKRATATDCELILVRPSRVVYPGTLGGFTGMIDISVIVPARNRANTLAACLDSILEQTYAVAEILVVDDGSSDNTREVVGAYQQRNVKYTRLTDGSVRRQPGTSAFVPRRTNGLHSRTRMIFGCPTNLLFRSRHWSKEGRSKYLVVHGNGLRRNKRSGKVTRLDVPETSGECYAKLLTGPGPMFQSILTSRDAIAKCGYLDAACLRIQEWDTAIRLSKHCRFVHVDEPLFVWVWHDGETIS